MISEQTAIHTPTRALRVRPFADMALAVEVTGNRPTGWRRRLQVVAQQARTLLITVLGVLAAWGNPSFFERERCFCIAIGSGSVRACQQALEAVWRSYINAHTFTLDNGRAVWIDEYQTFFLDTDPCDDTETPGRDSMSGYDQWLQAQVWGW
jgi:hypothetical protein